MSSPLPASLSADSRCSPEVPSFGTSIRNCAYRHLHLCRSWTTHSPKCAKWVLDVLGCSLRLLLSSSVCWAGSVCRDRLPSAYSHQHCNPFAKERVSCDASAQAGLPGSFMLTTESFSNVAVAHQTRPGTASTSSTRFPHCLPPMVGAATVLSALSCPSAETLRTFGSTLPTVLLIWTSVSSAEGIHTEKHTRQIRQTVCTLTVYKVCKELLNTVCS